MTSLSSTLPEHIERKNTLFFFKSTTPREFLFFLSVDAENNCTQLAYDLGFSDV